MKTRSALTVTFLVLICSTGLSQTLRLGLGGGPAFVQSGDNGYTRDIQNGGLAFNVAYALGGKAELSIPASPISITGRVSYMFMRGSGVVKNPRLYYRDTGSVETRLHIWSVGLGGQWNVLSGPVAPYIGAQILLSSFSKLSFKQTNAGGTVEYLSGGATTVGMQIEVGSRFSMGRSVWLDVGANYSFHSPFSTYQMSGFSSLGFSAEVLFAVN